MAAKKKSSHHKLESGGRIIFHNDANDTPFESLDKNTLDFGSFRFARNCAGHLQVKTSKKNWQLSSKNDYFWYLSDEYLQKMSNSVLW